MILKSEVPISLIITIYLILVIHTQISPMFSIQKRLLAS
jgi:hypothetical protein